MNLENLYKQLANDIEKDIVSGIYLDGDMLPSENECMMKYNVSRCTARKAFDLLTSKKLIRSVKGKGRYVSISSDTQLLKRKKIAVLFHGIVEFFYPVSETILARAKVCGYDCEVYYTENIKMEKELLEVLIKSGIDGVIISPIRTQGSYSFSNYRLLEINNINFVMFGKPTEYILCDAVYCDDVHMSNMVVKIFKENMACRNFIHITKTDCDIIAVKERTYGFKLGIKEYTKNVDGKKLILDKCGKNFTEEFIEACDTSIGNIGIYLLDDKLFPQIYKLITKTNKVLGKDIFIIGYTNSSMCTRYPVSLSTMSVPLSEMGGLAFDMLKKRMNGISTFAYKHLIVKPTYISRETTQFSQSKKDGK